MLRKKAKTDRHLAQKILATGRNFHGVYVTVRTMKILDKKSTFSFVVSKKVAAHAHERNKLKRQGLAVVAGYYKNVHPHTSSLFFVKKTAVSASYSDIKNDIHNVLVKSGLLS